LALAVAGINQRVLDATTTRQDENELGVNTAIFVDIPLDLLMKYWYRARRTCRAQPFHARLRWLENMDVQERTEWIRTYRNSGKTLGVIIDEVFNQRDAHWSQVANTFEEKPTKFQKAEPKLKARSRSTRQQSAPLAIRDKATPGAPQGKGRGQPKGGTKGESKGKNLGTSATMKDGTKLCPDFQKGSCMTTGRRCAKGEHKCGVLTGDNGRVCAHPMHGANDHGRST
jgi:hypothetical protein